MKAIRDNTLFPIELYTHWQWPTGSFCKYDVILIATFITLTSVEEWSIRAFLIAELQIQILALIENLEWLYIWGVVVRCSFDCTPSSVGPSVGRSVGRGI